MHSVGPLLIPWYVGVHRLPSVPAPSSCQTPGVKDRHRLAAHNAASLCLSLTMLACTAWMSASTTQPFAHITSHWALNLSQQQEAKSHRPLLGTPSASAQTAPCWCRPAASMPPLLRCHQLCTPGLAQSPYSLSAAAPHTPRAACRPCRWRSGALPPAHRMLLTHKHGSQCWSAPARSMRPGTSLRQEPCCTALQRPSALSSTAWL